MEILKYEFSPIASVMYMIIENDTALIIDPCVDSCAFAALNAANVTEVLVLLTHEHCDHITGVNWFRENFDTRVICSAKCAENIKDSKKNLSEYFDILLMDKPNSNYHMKPFDCRADEWFDEEKHIKWHTHDLYLRRIPGHSEGSICILLDNKYAFTGDYLIPGQKVFTHIPGGSRREYIVKALPYLNTLREKNILPGHNIKI